jgi:hypothetical protein
MRTVYEKLMGIKGAFALCVLGLMAAAPLYAQVDPDRLASTESPEDRADRAHAADPSEMDTMVVDPTFEAEPADEAAVDERETTPSTRGSSLLRPGLGARAIAREVEALDVDETQDDGDSAPKRDPKKDVKKDAPKSDDKAKGGDKAKSATSKKPAGCVDVTSEARFASVGYDHIVTLTSDCKKPVQCTVRTNVSPEPASVALAPRAQESVVTWRGSPSRVFIPDVTCD